MCELISATTEEEKKCVDTYLCSVWGNMLPYLKCEQAYFEFFSVDGIVMIKTVLPEQLKTSTASAP